MGSHNPLREEAKSGSQSAAEIQTSHASLQRAKIRRDNGSSLGKLSAVQKYVAPVIHRISVLPALIVRLQGNSGYGCSYEIATLQNGRVIHREAEVREISGVRNASASDRGCAAAGWPLARAAIVLRVSRLLTEVCQNREPRITAIIGLNNG